MNNTQTLEQLRSLRLTGMYDYYKQLLNMPAHEHPDAHQLIAMLAQSEHLWRTNRKTERYVKQARFRYTAALESIDYHPDRYLDKTTVQALADCSFIDRGENILITGATGCGKSYMATALGQQACSLGYKSLYVSMPKLTEQVLSSRADASYQKLILRLAKPDVLILDDFGLSPVDQNMRLTLLQILEDRYEYKSLIITSQLPFNTWYEYIGEPTLADAIMDRMSAKAHHIQLQGQSMRKKTLKK
jgi:DNA replication protein DnaC